MNFIKFKNWKNYIKGFYDTYTKQYKVIITGSSKLNMYRKGGDSLMGRYFNYTVHPLTVGELLRTTVSKNDDICTPIECKADLYQSLFKFGGYPDPLIKQEETFHRMWQNSRFSTTI